MPGLDRRITVRTTITGQDEFGRPTGTENTDREVWAARIDKTARRVVDEGGAIGLRKRTYRIRYRKDILEATQEDATARVIDDGLELTIENVVAAADAGPLAERRRFLELEVKGATD